MTQHLNDGSAASSRSATSGGRTTSDGPTTSGGPTIRPSATLRALAALLVLASMAMSGCALYLPEQQSARILPVGDWEVTPSFTSVWFSVEGETERVQNHYGVRVGYGATEGVEVRGGIERVSAVEDFGDDGNVNMLGGGPKISLAEETAALYVPVGFAFGGNVESGETWTVAPTLLFTFDASPELEINPSAKVIFPFAVDDPEVMLGFHLGLGWTPEGVPIMVRPEAGMVINPGQDGRAWGLTLGFSFRP